MFKLRNQMLIAAFYFLAISSAYSQNVTMGSSLASAPNFDLSCALLPAIAEPNGNFGLFNSGASSCTWRQSGVFGVTSGDTRFSSVPADGRIVSISVRSGSNPAPLRFSIFRQLSTPGFGAQSQCCFFVSETNEVQPVPNAITTFAANIPVERNTIRGFLAADLIGVSARTGTGSLPLRLLTNQPNAFQMTQFGSVNAGFFYPRIGALANDVGGGRREETMPGVELLMQWTWSPVNVSVLPNNTVARSISTRVARGRAPIDIICGANAVCRGVLELISNSQAAAIEDSVVMAAKVVRYGKQNYTVKAKKSKKIRVSLNKKAMKILKQDKNLPVTLRLKPKKGPAQTINMNLTL